MAERILADRKVRVVPPDEPLTTTAVARALRMTPEGVRYLVREARLACRRTQAQWRVFQPGDVLTLAEQRTRARLAGKLPRRGRLGPRSGPRQMSLFGLRKVK